MARPFVPHCKECNYYQYVSTGLLGYHKCNIENVNKGAWGGKCMTQKESRTSPIWCRRRPGYSK